MHITDAHLRNTCIPEGLPWTDRDGNLHVITSMEWRGASNAAHEVTLRTRDGRFIVLDDNDLTRTDAITLGCPDWWGVLITPAVG